jgi:hypothetical protein
MDSLFLMWFCRRMVSEPDLGLTTHSKHLKIVTTFTVRMLSPYKDYSSLLKWQANICVYIATTELHQRRYVVDFKSV